MPPAKKFMFKAIQLPQRLRDAAQVRGHDNPLWLIIYSDMITNLMIFFLIMFAFAYGGSTNYEKMAQALEEQFGKKKTAQEMLKEVRKEEEQKAAKKVEKIAQDQSLQQVMEVQINERRIKIRLTTPILFRSGSEDLSPEFIPVLHQVATVLRDLPNPVVVEGHTDDRPLGQGKRYSSNLQLSSARASSVIEFFIGAEGMDPRRFSAVGFGEYRPLMPNDTPGHRARNRRIEINVLRLGEEKT